MWKESIRPFTVLSLWAVVVACANLNERGAAAAGTEVGKSAASAVQVRELQGGSAASEKKAAPVSRQRIIIRDRAPQEPLHRTFDREREEQYEEEEEHRGRARHRDD